MGGQYLSLHRLAIVEKRSLILKQTVINSIMRRMFAYCLTGLLNSAAACLPKLDMECPIEIRFNNLTLLYNEQQRSFIDAGHDVLMAINPADSSWMYKSGELTTGFCSRKNKHIMLFRVRRDHLIRG